MAVYQMHYNEEDINKYPAVKNFLASNAKGKAEVFFSSLESVLEAYLANGFSIPEKKTDISNLMTFINNSKVVNAYMLSMFAENPMKLKYIERIGK